MNVGLGLPVDDPDVLLTWARRADAGPFSTVAILDRLPYQNPEVLITLAAIAGATERVRVQSEVILTPIRETTLLAKQAATLDRISGGRFTMGIGVGGRPDDYLATGYDVHTRGRRLDEQMAVLRDIWVGKPVSDQVPPIGPAPARAGGPEILFGAFSARALERVAKWGDGFLGAAPPEQMDSMFRAVEQSWEAHGRDGKPRLVAQVNVAVGPESTLQNARKNIGSYYGFLGDYTASVVNSLITGEAGIRGAVKTLTDLGADEVMLYCYGTDPDQVDRLADLVA